MIGLGGRWSEGERATLRALLSRVGMEVVDVVEPRPGVMARVRACLLAPGEVRDATRWCVAAGATRLLFTCDSAATCREAIASARPCDDVCGVHEAPDLQAERLQRLLRPFPTGPLDTLTGLPNRLAAEAASQAWIPDPTGAQVHAVLLVALDRFMSVNDRFGHGVGDEVLRAVARAIVSVPDIGGIWRWAGDEFLVHECSPDVATIETLAHRVREAIASLRCAPAEARATIAITASIGWAPFEGSLRDAARCAHMAVSQAKSAGGNRVVGFLRP